MVEVIMETLRRELKRGTIELVLLSLLKGEDMYGYQIVASLEERGGPLFKLKEGTLYPVLYRLEDSGYIDSYRDNPKRGVPRKYYKLTHDGAMRLTAMKEEWTQFVDVISKLTKSSEVNDGQD